MRSLVIKRVSEIRTEYTFENFLYDLRTVATALGSGAYGCVLKIRRTHPQTLDISNRLVYMEFNKEYVAIKLMTIQTMDDFSIMNWRGPKVPKKSTSTHEYMQKVIIIIIITTTIIKFRIFFKTNVWYSGVQRV